MKIGAVRTPKQLGKAGPGVIEARVRCRVFLSAYGFGEDVDELLVDGIHIDFRRLLPRDEGFNELVDEEFYLFAAWISDPGLYRVGQHFRCFGPLAFPHLHFSDPRGGNERQRTFRPAFKELTVEHGDALPVLGALHDRGGRFERVLDHVVRAFRPDSFFV